MKQVASPLWLVLAMVALLSIFFTAVNPHSFSWFSPQCRQMAAFQEIYTFPNADTTEQKRLADHLVIGEDERIFQPEQMDVTTRAQYKKAVEGCKAQTRS